MVNQGDIIMVNFNPQLGHEQAGYRPAVVISNNFFNEITRMTILCPITNNAKKFPLHLPLDDRTVTDGVVLCEHTKSLDLYARDYKFVEKIPDDLLKEILEIVFSEIEFQTI